MEQIGVHEYFRLFVPAVFLVGVLRIYFPDRLPADVSSLVVVAAFVGLLTSPVVDRLAKYYFHRQVVTVGFYDRLLTSFARYYQLDLQSRDHVSFDSFSGRVKLPMNRESRCVLEAYKIFSRQGWGGSAETYRVRTEKSFGILYLALSVNCMMLVAVCWVLPTAGLRAKPLAGHLVIDGSLFLTLAALALVESRCRFRMSLENELLVLEAHIVELRTLYDRLIKMLEVQQ